MSCGATIAKRLPRKRIVDLTRVNWNPGTAEIGDKEAKEAATIRGVELPGESKICRWLFVNDKNHQLELIKVIRKYQPDIVLCNAISDRHIDHGKGSRLVSDACFLSGLLKLKPQLMVSNKQNGGPNMSITISNGMN